MEQLVLRMKMKMRSSRRAMMVGHPRYQDQHQQARAGKVWVRVGQPPDVRRNEDCQCTVHTVASTSVPQEPVRACSSSSLIMWQGGLNRKQQSTLINAVYKQHNINIVDYYAL